MNQPPPLERPTATHDDCERIANSVITLRFFIGHTSVQKRDYERPRCSRSPALYASRNVLAINLFAAIVLPLLFEVFRVFIGARINSHDDAAFLETGLVCLCVFFGDSPTDECADEASR